MVTQQLRKKVGFEANAVIILVPALSDYTWEERRATWFSNEDYFHQRYRELKIAKRCSSGDYELEQLQAHGIETELERMNRKERVRLATLSVLLEQENQWSRGAMQPDPEHIARVYAKFTTESRYQALRAGLWRYLHTEQHIPAPCAISKRDFPSATRQRQDKSKRLQFPPHMIPEIFL